MSGHFVLEGLSDQELEDIQNAWLADKLTVPVLSGLAHAAGTDNGMGGQFPGWNANSRAELTRALGGTVLTNRSGLPPHVYLGFGVGNISPAGESAKYLVRNYNANGWITRIARPAGMGLSALHVNAAGDWVTNKAKAFAKQIVGNGVSLEIYKTGVSGTTEV